ncbi:GIY-YIG nuclease family protein [Candidatus Halocynthiibacter alkanivorans]|uniref:GIY-YIG nuclease family protein n=1 Tax=Candidatus Halocynthiibacter alkanivorans TaxID=2267619 RepID=UPI000DF49B39|nr:GIY-YIG nuclease family protein [Candidatus Halocynthiibacter alkanivorans]
MLRSSELFHLWKRQVFLRNRHEEFTALLSRTRAPSGIYMIGCAKEIVYIGQSNRLQWRSIESLGNIYHRVSDTSLTWSVAFAPCAYEEMDERESTAIRAYAPKFNTSIPSVGKSSGRMPVIVGFASVFQDQSDHGDTFHPDNLSLQMDLAEANETPPWSAGRNLMPASKPLRTEQLFSLQEPTPSNRSRRSQFRPTLRRRTISPAAKSKQMKTVFNYKDLEIQINERVPQVAEEHSIEFDWLATGYGKTIASGTEFDKAMAATNAMEACDKYLSQPYRFKINLCDDGSVVTRDGEYIGTWETDEYDVISFIPNGESEPLYSQMWMGPLCKRIADWHEATSGEPIGD